MNQKAIRRVFEEVVEAYREEASGNISEHATSKEAEEAMYKKLDQKVKRWRRRLERLTERSQGND